MVCWLCQKVSVVSKSYFNNVHSLLRPVETVVEFISLHNSGWTAASAVTAAVHYTAGLHYGDASQELTAR